MVQRQRSKPSARACCWMPAFTSMARGLADGEVKLVEDVLSDVAHGAEFAADEDVRLAVDGFALGEETGNLLLWIWALQEGAV